MEHSAQHQFVSKLRKLGGRLPAKTPVTGTPLLDKMLVTKTLSIVVFREERPVTTMVFEMCDIASRHRFPFAGTLSTIRFFD